jgi:hypothetical protein
VTNGTAIASSEGGSGGKGTHPFAPAAPVVDTPASDAFSAALRAVQLGVGRAVITASRASERSWEADEYKNGCFTHFLLDALRDGGTKPLAELFPGLRSRVFEAVRASYRQSQTPTAEFSPNAGSIVIGIPEVN